MRTTFSREIQNTEEFKKKVLHWSQSSREVVYLESNDYPQKYYSNNAIIAVDAFTSIKTDSTNAFTKLEEYVRHTKDWIFGYLTYDLKNDVEELYSNNTDLVEFPDLFFFQPKKIFIFKEDKIEAHYLNFCDDEFESDFNEIEAIKEVDFSGIIPKIEHRISMNQYIEKVNQMLWHIHRGDIYEANFCMEFFVENLQIEPVSIFNKLNEISKPPFATFLKVDHNYALCASPERYLKKERTKVISQPIKGTARRSSDKIEDETIIIELENNPKERSENIMIVDLVRNDLSRTALPGSVHVEELCKVYTFPQVHQMISTIVSQVDENCSPIEILKTTFPMGSMTGAPKISAMNIIEKLEETKRGLYSGSIGYFTPEGDFDFNVVIRTILYNAKNKYLSYSVGSAITAQALPENEYEECLIKAKALFEVIR